MTQEERLLAGLAFCPGDAALRAVKLRCHELCARYNALLESQSGERAALLAQIFAALGEGSFLQGPIYIHYGVHTRIGARFFGNFNLTIQDDAPVTIGDDCNFGPGVTIVTPLHPMLPQERRAVRDPQGQPQRQVHAGLELVDVPGEPGDQGRGADLVQLLIGKPSDVGEQALPHVRGKAHRRLSGKILGHHGAGQAAQAQ